MNVSKYPLPIGEPYNIGYFTKEVTGGSITVSKTMIDNFIVQVGIKLDEYSIPKDYVIVTIPTDNAQNDYINLSAFAYSNNEMISQNVPYEDPMQTYDYDFSQGLFFVSARAYGEDNIQNVSGGSMIGGFSIHSSDFISSGEFITDSFVPQYILWTNCEGIKDASGQIIFNYVNNFEVNKTKTYHITNTYGNGDLLYGSVSLHNGSQLTQKSMRIMANKTPVLYFTGDGFQLRLTAGGVIASKAVNGPDYIIDNIPESQWTEGTLDYTGYWYGNVNEYAKAKGTLPDAGTYLYGFEFKTDCYIFADQADAEEAEETGVYDKAINAYDVETGYYKIPVVGQEEDATTFGSGGVTSPFVSTYVCDRNDVLNVANAFYSNDASVIDNIKKGLELFGSEPFQALCGLKWFPCSLASVVTTSPQNHVYFGSYKYESATLSIDKVISITANGYIDAGTVTLTPVQQSFRSFEPYCGLSVFLPYIGWQKLRIADYWGKTVNVRYYLDIYTGSCIAALVANNVFTDYFTGNLGVELPLTGQMLSQYANSALNGILGTAGGALGGAAGAAMLAGPQGLALGAGAAAAMAIGGAAVGAGSGIFKMAQKGAPKDHNTTKGSFTSSVGAYLPQYVMFRWEVHDLIIPELLTDLYGRPSAASGKVSSFSGFLQCDTIKLNTSGMNDSEANEVAALLKEGVFV